MKKAINTPQPKRIQKKFEAMDKEREQLLGLAMEHLKKEPVEIVISRLIDHYLLFKYADKGLTKGFTMPIFREAVTFKKKGKDAVKKSQQEKKVASAKRFGKLCAENGIAITDKLTAGKALNLLREKGVNEKDLRDEKTVRGYIELLLATTSKVSKIKKVL